MATGNSKELHLSEGKKVDEKRINEIKRKHFFYNTNSYESIPLANFSLTIKEGKKFIFRFDESFLQ